ncbi:MAG: O-antigen ligase family protein [Patescibacteria group bacterium]
MKKQKILKNNLPEKIFPFLVFLLPFVFALNPADKIDLAVIRILIPALFLWWLAASLLNKNLLIDTRFRFWALASLLFLSLISLNWAEEKEWAVRKILFLGSVFPLYFLSFSYFRKKTGNFDRFCKFLSLSAFATALLGIIQFFSQFIFSIDSVLSFHHRLTPFFLGNNFAEQVKEYNSWAVNLGGETFLRAFGTFPDPHLFAIFLNLSLPFVFYNYLKTKQKKYLAISLLIFLAVLLSFSRAGYLALFVLIGAGVFLLNIFKKSFPAFLVFLVVILISLNFFGPRLLSSFNLQEGSVSGRIEMLSKSWQVFADRPLTGAGIGNLPGEIDSQTDYRDPVYAHNLFLDFASELGILGLFLLGLFVLAPLKKFLQAEVDLKTKIVMLAVLALLVHSMFETPFYSVRVFPLILTIISI